MKKPAGIKEILDDTTAVDTEGNVRYIGDFSDIDQIDQDQDAADLQWAVEEYDQLVRPMDNPNGHDIGQRALQLVGGESRTSATPPEVTATVTFLDRIRAELGPLAHDSFTEEGDQSPPDNRERASGSKK